MDLLRIYLLAGLIAHKAVWEIMKRPDRAAARRTSPPLRVRAVKAVKILILLGICAQTLLPDIAPILKEPAALRATGVVLYTLGLLLAITARIQLGGNWLDIESADVKRDQAVVSHGVYGYVRHPVYVGDILLLFGLELALNSWLVLLVAALTPVVLRQAIREEKMLEQRLAGYDAYRQRTKRFIPFIA